MDRLLAPAVAFMSRLRFAGKFGVLALVFALPVLVVISLLYAETRRDIVAAGQERRGIEYVTEVAKLLHALQAHNAASAVLAAGGGSESARAEVAAAARSVDAMIARVREAQGRHGAEFASAERAQNLFDHWSAIRDKVASFTLEQSLAEHRAMSDEVLDLMYFVAERSRLLLDPQARSAYLQDASVSRIPELLAALGQARALLAAGGKDTAALAMEYQLAVKGFAAATRGFVNAFGGSDVEIADEGLARRKSDFEASSGAFLEHLGARLKTGAGGSEADALGAKAIDDALGADAAAFVVLDREIEARAVAKRRVQLGVLAVVLACLLAASYLLVAFSRSMSRSMSEAMSLAARISEGDLTHRIRSSSRDELGELVASLNEMSERMAQLVAGVKGSSDEVMSSARQVAEANSDLSSRTDRQASSLEEMAASTEELAAAVAQGTRKIEDAGSLVARASDAAAAGNESMTRALDSMGEVERMSRKIGEITAVIDGIAFQSNILAINAAVEAARVGVEGRGFAVVAGEIRSLSQRSATSAREIRKLIDSTVGAIDSGATLVGQAGRGLGETVESFRQAVQMMREVTDMAKQQGRSIDQISAAVTEMSGVTQQNAAFVQETSEVALRQESSARGLVEAVSGFRIELAAPSGARLMYRGVLDPRGGHGEARDAAGDVRPLAEDGEPERLSAAEPHVPGARSPGAREEDPRAGGRRALAQGQPQHAAAVHQVPRVPARHVEGRTKGLARGR